MLINYSINDYNYKTDKKLTLIQACMLNGVDIPRFCYHEKLSIAGNCRMCLVEDLKQVKPLAACSINVSNNMNIYTYTVKVKKARESVLSFLLANHPLDCPICDQGGECDLQDQSMIFGGDRGRFYEEKRSVEDKNCGPLIKTIMNRCIHCTRCVRFSSEIAGDSILGVTGRGLKMEIGFYIDKLLNNELSGNVIDLCPVGALTSKPFSFTARSWELKSYDSIDILDNLGSNIRLDVRGSKILRILPRVNNFVNGDWISDKIRFCYDAIHNQRLSSPMVSLNGILLKTSWEHCLYYLKNIFINSIRLCKSLNYKSNVLNTFIGNFVDNETLSLLKVFNSNFSVQSVSPLNYYTKEFINSYNNVNSDFREFYCFNKQVSISSKDSKNIDLCLLVGGVNLRLDSPVLNSYFRQHYRKGNMLVYNLGFCSNFTFFVKNLGLNNTVLIQILQGIHWFCNKLIKLNSKNPIILVNQSKFKYMPLFFDNLSLFQKHTNLFNEGIGVSLFSNFTNNFSLNELNMSNFMQNHLYLDNSFPKIHYLIGYDTNVYNKYISNISNFGKGNKKPIIIYQGQHGDFGAQISNIVLPSTMFFEKNSSYTNLFGLTQKTKSAINCFGNSRDDWKIINAVLNVWGKPPITIKGSYDVFSILNRFSPFYGNQNKITNYNLNFIDYFKIKAPFIFYKVSFYYTSLLNASINNNFYKADSISRNSRVLSICHNKFKVKNFNFVI